MDSNPHYTELLRTIIEKKEYIICQQISISIIRCNLKINHSFVIDYLLLIVISICHNLAIHIAPFLLWGGLQEAEVLVL
ncbi:hypothetical protein CEN45_19570 [Fischerella thermalis CCMEE 5198]|jgi:hypothetical protein|nr:hypothetical protein CEN45_19570 [Fischerella thermalis CCMEE 5198]PMB48498.1 hypothetical protein CEN39_22885 [Fischerella thermalis CCMEE 5201]